MIPAEQRNKCEQVGPLLVFYACGEADETEVPLIERHLAACEVCRKQFTEEKKFQSMVEDVPQDADRLDASGVLLSQCRSELGEKLDDLARPPVLEKTAGFSAFRRWMASRPVWSSAALVLLGVVVGVQFSQWFHSRDNTNPIAQAVNVRPTPRISDDQLSKINVARINFTPDDASGEQNVRVQLNAEQPMELTGSLDNSDVRRVLTYVVKNGERFDPGIRLDCLDALKARAGDAEVRAALLAAARNDQNPAVRLKALEALHGSTSEEAVRELLLDTLKHDTNPGVRVEAVNLLVGSLENVSEEPGMNATISNMPPVESGEVIAAGAPRNAPHAPLAALIRELEALQHSDPSRYVRLRSAAALRQLSARNDQ